MGPFSTFANNLSGLSDTNLSLDVFVRDLVNGSNILRALSPRPRPATQEDWERNKCTIKSLYMDQNFKLWDVIDIMETVHSFRATYVSSYNSHV